MAKASNLIGNRYGKLLVIERAENNKRGNTQWLCQCDCGKTRIALGYDLTHGRTVSCGCNPSGKPSKKRIDLCGKRFGKLVVLSLSDEKSTPQSLVWKCKCDCGNITFVRSSNLRYGTTKSCGCLSKEMIKYDDLSGNRYGRLTVNKISYKGKRGVYWECLCDCGNIKNVCSVELKTGNTKSCGCLLKDTSRKNGKKRKTHGMSKTRLYSEWRSLINRCSPKYHSHNLYYDRGISFCEEWKIFETFKKWALENGYSDKLTLDRIDNDKGYFPDNCRWVSMKEQQNNKRNNVLFTINGETKTMKQWSEYFNVPYGTVKARHRKNKPISELFAPVHS